MGDNVYDEEGNLIENLPPKKQIPEGDYVQRYDDKDQLIYCKHPGGFEEWFEYDSKGFLVGYRTYKPSDDS